MGNGRNPFETENHANRTPGRDETPASLNSVDILRAGPAAGKPAKIERENSTNNAAEKGTGPAAVDPIRAVLTTSRKPAELSPTDLPIGGAVSFGDRNATEEHRLAIEFLTQAKGQPVDQPVPVEQSALREYGSDAAAIGAGFLSKYGIQRLLTKAPGWGKVAGIGLGLATAGFTKDLVKNGEIGSGSDWLRGSAMFGGSMLLARGLSMARSKHALGEATTTGIEARSGTMSEKEWDRLIAISNETKQRLTGTGGMTPNEIMYHLFKP